MKCLGSPMSLARPILLCFGSMSVAHPLEPNDIVVAATLPLYPSAAVAARIEGTVVATIKVSKGVVTEAAIVSGPPILASSVKRNLLTWRFDSNVNGTQRASYVFVLSETTVLVPENPELELRLPEFVKITAKPVRPVTVDGDEPAASTR